MSTTPANVIEFTAAGDAARAFAAEGRIELSERFGATARATVKTPLPMNLTAEEALLEWSREFTDGTRGLEWLKALQDRYDALKAAEQTGVAAAQVFVERLETNEELEARRPLTDNMGHAAGESNHRRYVHDGGHHRTDAAKRVDYRKRHGRLEPVALPAFLTVS